jgi:membrane-associated protease RseP (regulator of RpoE activity)
VKDPLEEAGAGVGRRVATFVFVGVLTGLIALAIFKPGSRTALAIVLGLVLMVMLHEAGHYITAKRAGMKVTEFFVGFGPRLWSFRRGETEYGVKAILLGGYVRIVGMSNLEEVPPEDEPRTYRQASFKDRMVVVMAGVTVNVILCAVLFFAVIAGQGRVADGLSAKVARVVNGSAADDAHFHKDDKIVQVGNDRITGWEDLKKAIESRGGEPTKFVVIRHGERVALTAKPEKQNGQGFLGISPAFAFRDVGVFEAVPETFRAMGDVVVRTGEGFGRFFSPAGVERYSKNFTGPAPKSGTPAAQERPIGIIGIVDQGSDLVNGNIWALLWLLGAISLLLAIVNALPLPPLDGGHAAVVVYEWAASKVTHRRVQVDYRRLMPVVAVVLALFLTLGLSTAFLDIRQAVGN